MKYSYLAFILVCLGYIIYVLITTPPSSGYEVSIYDAFPLSFWIVYGIIYLVNVIVVFYTNKKLWHNIALGTLLVLTLMLIALPLQRNYFCIDSTDSLSHLTYIKNYLTEGTLRLSLSTIDPYPILHIIAITLGKIGIPLEDTIQIAPLLCYIWYIVFIYLVCSRWFKNKLLVSLIILLTLLPLIRFQEFYPFKLFILLLPSYIFFLYKNWFIPVVIMSIILPLCHPATMITLLALIIPLIIILYLQGYRFRRKNIVIIWALATIVITCGIWFLITRGQVMRIIGGMFNIVSQISSGGNIAQPYREILANLSMANLNILGELKMYLVTYGGIHIILIIGTVYSMVNIWRLIRGNLNRSHRLITLSVLCIFCNLLYLLSYLVLIDMLSNRIYIFACLVSILLVAHMIFGIIGNGRQASGITKQIPRILCVLFLVALNTLTVFTYYDSPINKRPPLQTTRSEINAMTWLLANKNPELNVYDLLRHQGRMTGYILGVKYDHKTDISKLDKIGLPFHFGYNKSPVLRKSIGEDCYLITDVKNIITSTQIYPEYANIWAYHPDDYERLKTDPSVSEIYKEDGITIYYISDNKPK